MWSGSQAFKEFRPDRSAGRLPHPGALRQLFGGARPWLTDAARQTLNQSPGRDPTELLEQV